MNLVKEDKKWGEYLENRRKAFQQFLKDEISFKKYLEIWDEEFEEALGV